MHPYFRFYYERLLAGLVIVGILALVKVIVRALR